MEDHLNQVTAPVRTSPEKSRAQDIPVTRIQVRVDFFPHAGELDISFIAWHHPMGVLVKNEIWSHYDAAHIGMAAHDMVAQLYDLMKAFPEPF